MLDEIKEYNLNNLIEQPSRLRQTWGRTIDGKKAAQDSELVKHVKDQIDLGKCDKFHDQSELEEACTFHNVRNKILEQNSWTFVDYSSIIVMMHNPNEKQLPMSVMTKEGNIATEKIWNFDPTDSTAKSAFIDFWNGLDLSDSPRANHICNKDLKQKMIKLKLHQSSVSLAYQKFIQAEIAILQVQNIMFHFSNGKLFLSISIVKYMSFQLSN